MKKLFIGMGLFVTAVLIVCAVLILGFPVKVLDGVNYLSYRSAGLSKHAITIDDHNWTYLSGGNGEPIVFIHGIGGKDGYAEFLANYTASHAIYLPDLPGFGESTKLMTAGYSVGEQVKRLHAFVRKIGLTSFHLAGHAYGGGVAAWYASEYPDDVRSLLLMVPMGIDTGRADDTKEVLRRLEREQNNFLFMGTAQQVDQFLEFFFYTKPNVPDIFKAAIAEKMNKNRPFMEKIYGDSLRDGFDFMRKRMHRITAPTLILWGRDDRFASPGCAEILRRGIPNSRVVVYDRCRHVPYIDRAEETIGEYRTFLGSAKK